MKLTEAGRVLYNRSGQIIELCNETAETIRTLHASRNSQVRIATGIMIHEFLYEIIAFDPTHNVSCIIVGCYVRWISG